MTTNTYVHMYIIVYFMLPFFISKLHKNDCSLFSDEARIIFKTYVNKLASVKVENVSNL